MGSPIPTYKFQKEMTRVTTWISLGIEGWFSLVRQNISKYMCIIMKNNALQRIKMHNDE